MNCIVTVDRNWAIGYRGQPLVEIPAERKQLLNETAGKVLVMGRKTFEALLGGRPLHGRKTLVLSGNPEYVIRGAAVCHSAEEILVKLRNYAGEDVFLIGGGQTYRQFLPYCDEVRVVWVDYEYEADAWFPNLEQSEEWELAAESDEQTYFNLCYTCRMYRRKRI